MLCTKCLYFSLSFFVNMCLVVVARFPESKKRKRGAVVVFFFGFFFLYLANLFFSFSAGRSLFPPSLPSLALFAPLSRPSFPLASNRACVRQVTSLLSSVLLRLQNPETKRKRQRTTISNVVFDRFLMLSVSPCGTFKRFAVHENEMEKSFMVISLMSQPILTTRHVTQRFLKI